MEEAAKADPPHRGWGQPHPKTEATRMGSATWGF